MRRLLTLSIACSVLCSYAHQLRAETRLALVVGIGSYVHAGALPTALNDARDMSAALRRTGFEVVETLDGDKRRLDEALRGFADRLARADVALFFYSGHGMQVGGQSYLVPADARLERERDLELETVRLDFVLRQLEIDREGKTSIVILDACRQNPLARNLARGMGTRAGAIGHGLARPSIGLGTFIVYAAQPGAVSVEGSGRNSPLVESLIRQIGVPGRDLAATMSEVRRHVAAATGDRQVPWVNSALTSDFHFVSAPAAAPSPVHASVAAGTASLDAALAALQLRLRKLEDEARRREAALAPAPAAPLSPARASGGAGAPSLPAALRSLLPSRRERGLVVFDGWELEGGEVIDAAPAETSAACATMCHNTPGCGAASFSVHRGRRAACVLLREAASARERAAGWSALIRPD